MGSTKMMTRISNRTKQQAHFGTLSQPLRKQLAFRHTEAHTQQHMVLGWLGVNFRQTTAAFVSCAPFLLARPLPCRLLLWCYCEPKSQIVPPSRREQQGTGKVEWVLPHELFPVARRRPGRHISSDMKEGKKKGDKKQATETVEKR